MQKLAVRDSSLVPKFIVWEWSQATPHCPIDKKCPREKYSKFLSH